MVGLDLDIFGNETPYLFLFNFRILLRGAQFFFFFLLGLFAIYLIFNNNFVKEP